MRERRRLILWDVDGTLVAAGPAAQTAFDLAVASVIGRDAYDHGVHMSGKTDPQIALEILASLSVPEARAREQLPQVLEALERELAGVAEVIRESGRVHPGVAELLPRLHGEPGVIQTVLTGNLATNAVLKVAAFGLERWLDLEVGAFGSDDPDRTLLVPVAMAKVERRDGVRLAQDDVWVVGDTPRDLACARAAGSRCLLVATGRYGLAELSPLGADAVLPDLADTERVCRILLGNDGAGR